MATEVHTLAVDVGGTGVKATVLDAAGEMVAERIRVKTPYPARPQRIVDTIAELAAKLPPYHRASVGLPGLVREGQVIFMANLSRSAPGEPIDATISKEWTGFPIEAALNKALSVPTRVANDADVQGSAVIKGQGMEFVLTLGTGAGTAVFYDGRLLPHLELGHAPFRSDESFEDQIGNEALREVGRQRWVRRVKKALRAYDQFLFYDRCYVGGGNSRLLVKEDLGPKVEIVSNKAGLIGGIRLWEVSDRAGE
jgi:polyphosphate glucokinase